MTPYKPAALSQMDVDVLNELFLSKKILGISPNREGRGFRFLQTLPDLGGDSGFAFSLQADGRKIEIVLELAPESPLAERLKEVGGIASVPEEFQASLMAFCSGEIINSIEYLLQLPVTLWDESHKSVSNQDHKKLSFEVLAADSTVEARGKITLSFPLLKRVLSAAKEIPSLERDSLSQILLDGELIIGEATLSLQQWERLIPGDLIFLEEPSTLATGEGTFLLKKGGTLPVLFAEDQFQPLLLSLEEIFPAGFKPAAPVSKEETSSVTEKVYVELKMSAGSLALTIDELIHLGATQSIEQQIKASRPLQILTQEKFLGSGELVKISDRYAIVITQLKN